MTKDNKLSSENNRDSSTHAMPNSSDSQGEGLEETYINGDNLSIEEDPLQAAKLNTPRSEMKLDDARRIKVLSPGMMVFKRFIRNKLAVIGLVILFFMFLMNEPYNINNLNQVFTCFLGSL